MTKAILVAASLMLCVPTQCLKGESTNSTADLNDQLKYGVGVSDTLTPFQRFALAEWNGESREGEGGARGAVASGRITWSWVVRRERQAASRWPGLTGRTMQGNAGTISLGNEVWVPTALNPDGSPKVFGGSARRVDPVWCVETDAETSYCFPSAR